MLKALVQRNRRAERALIIYFRDSWDQGIEPDPYVLREYCEALFALSEGRPVLPNPGHRPPAMLAERNITVAATYYLLCQGDEPIAREDALKRTGKIFDISVKTVEGIITPKKQSAQEVLDLIDSYRPPQRLDLMAALVKILDASERAKLLQILHPTEPTTEPPHT